MHANNTALYLFNVAQMSADSKPQCTSSPIFLLDSGDAAAIVVRAMNRLLLVLPSVCWMCAAAEEPQLHVLQADYLAASEADAEPAVLTLKLAALADSALHERCMQEQENPPESDEETPSRYEEEKIWEQEEGGYIAVGRSCVSGVKTELRITDASGTVFSPVETELKEENGVLLITLVFENTLPQTDSLSISGNVAYNAHYNHDSELTETVNFTHPGQITIGAYSLTFVEPVADEEEEQIEKNEEIYDETEGTDEEYDDSFYADDQDEDVPSGFIEIAPINGDFSLNNLITNIIVCDEEGEMLGTFGNGDLTAFKWTYTCPEGLLPYQGKIRLRLRNKYISRQYQFNQQLPVFQKK